MTTKLESHLSADGTGTGYLLSGRVVVASINWRSICVDGVCHAGATPTDIIGLTRMRLEQEQRGGPFASPASAKAIVLLMQAEAELNGGQKTMDDGTPIIGGSQ